jgi:acetyl esterase/lipase
MIKSRFPNLQFSASAIALGLIASASATAQTPVRGGRGASTEPQEIRLWEGSAPRALGTADADTPALTYYSPRASNSRTAVIVAPGGGYGNLAMNHEGRQVANWFNAQGVAAFVLKYRLGPRYRHPIPLTDAQRAIRLVRTRAAEFNVNPDRIGIMGFSAGGHLASTAGTRFDAGAASATDAIDRASSRPDFLILAYPVIVSTPPFAHQGSFRNLLGEGADAAHLEEVASQRHVTKDTPPTFLFHTNADTGVPPENSIEFYTALRKAGVAAELHIFERGPHGVGLGMSDPALAAWPELLSNWLRLRGLLSPPQDTAAARGAARGRGQEQQPTRKATAYELSLHGVRRCAGFGGRLGVPRCATGRTRSGGSAAVRASLRECEPAVSE